MPNGIIIIHKPTDWTSMDVCAKLKGVMKERRIGHAGTLDPMATGVLPVFVGRATRVVEFAANGEKEYMVGLQLGITTDTQDSMGTTLSTAPAAVTGAELESVLAQFRGDIMQIPPMYSAIKIGGKKLYELARKGVEIDRPPRPVTIHMLELVEGEGSQFTLRVQCSKGTYMRTLCHDIGQVLGCGGIMSSLRRTMACGFLEEDAIPLEELFNHPDPQSLLLPVDTYFKEYPAMTIGGRPLVQAKNGAPFSATGEDGMWRVYSEEGDFLLLGQLRKGKMTTVKNFF